MKPAMTTRAILPLLALAFVLGGCGETTYNRHQAAQGGPAHPVTINTVAVAWTPETKASETFGVSTCAAALTPLETVEQPKVDYQDLGEATSLLSGVRLEAGTNAYGGGQPKHKFRMTRTAVYVQVPERLEITVTLTNASQRVVDYAKVAFDLQTGVAGFKPKVDFKGDRRVMPGKALTVVITGPKVDELAQGSPIALSAYDVPVAVDGTGNVTELQNKTWTAALSRTSVTKDVPITVTTEEYPVDVHGRPIF